MFDALKPKKDTEYSRQLAAESRDKEFARERDTIANSSTDDQTYMGFQAERSDLIKWQQNMDDEINEICREFLGQFKVKGQWVQLQEPLCNETFIYQVLLPLLRGFMSRNAINSNLDEKRILKMLELRCNEVADAMADGFDKYGITFVNFDVVMGKVKIACTFAAHRALRGWTKRLDSTMIKRIEAMNEQVQQQEKQKIFGVFSKNA